MNEPYLDDPFEDEAVYPLYKSTVSPEESYYQMRQAYNNLETRYKRYFEASPDTRFVVTEDGRLVDVNRAGVELFGFSNRQEMLQKASLVDLLWVRETRKRLRRNIMKYGSLKDYEIEMKKLDGAKFTAALTANIWFEEDGTVFYEGHLRDITEQKRRQDALIESEQRIRMLNEQILQMVMVMAHDIRAPHIAVAATLKLLLRGTYGKMDESVENTLKDLLGRVIHTLGIAEDCLGKAYAVGNTAKVEQEVLDLRQDVIDPVLDELANEIEKNEITIDNRMGAIPARTISVNANKIWLKVVYRNLFKNAIKYGGKGCTVAFGFEDRGPHYRLHVYNSGVPIPVEDRERLFTEFGKIGDPSSPDNRDSMGMGLYLIREIVSKHGGRIWYEATTDGSDFIFTLPKEDEEKKGGQEKSGMTE